MRTRNVRCTVIEVLGSDGGDSLEHGEPHVRDLLPWADPYIAKLLAKHRLQAALDDSLTYLRDESEIGEPSLPSDRFPANVPPWEA